ncbi:MAG: hypothetical protein HYZ27_10120, partial [Deltaproteobacteria bacterium]|nr:hypothetical protein [Deltaproteobacteria bacterium]
MQRFLLPVSMWVCTGVACTYLDGELPSVPGGSTTLRLEKESDGDLRYCDAQGDCVHDLPNPYDCTSLEVRIDEATGAVCETCYDANGRVIKDHCDNTSVTCVLLTNSDPDCLACAYIDRTVLYVTCAEEMPSCEYFAGDPSGAWAQTSPTSYECKRCYDASGRLIIESCAHDCTREVCMAVDCGEGFASVIYPGECCPRCEPIAHCGAVVCSAETAAVPTCFDGYRLERDANDCCAYRCVPESCSAVACPATDQRRPCGYTWDSSG